MTKCIKSTKIENNETLSNTTTSNRSGVLHPEAVYYTPKEVINEIEVKTIIKNPEYNHGNKKKDKNKR